MTTYKYTDASQEVVHIIDPDGVSRSSMLASALPGGVTILLADPESVSVPQVVTRRQARRALALFGLLGAVQAALDAIPDPMQRAIAQIDWDDATEFKRDDETLQMLAGALGLTGSQLDDLFILAGEQP